MDPENEVKMNAAIAEVIRNKTLIVIAHRLYTVMNADNICVLNNGTLVGCGTHGELLGSCGEYQKLWQAAEESTRWSVAAKEARV